MATTKKSPAKSKSTVTKKTAPKRKPTAKKPTTSKTTAARTRSRSTKATAAKTSRAAESKSFKLQNEKQPFLSFKVTIQTLYWLILAAAVLLLGIWVLNISQKVQAIYDEIDSNMSVQSDLDARELELMREKASKKTNE